MFEINSKVKIKKTGLICTVLDHIVTKSDDFYIVESDTKATGKDAEEWGKEWPLFTCVENELEKAS